MTTNFNKNSENILPYLFNYLLKYKWVLFFNIFFMICIYYIGLTVFDNHKKVLSDFAPWLSIDEKVKLSSRLVAHFSGIIFLYPIESLLNKFISNKLPEQESLPILYLILLLLGIIIQIPLYFTGVLY